MIRNPDAIVTLENGAPKIDVRRHGAVVEVRDYNLDRASRVPLRLWVGSEGRICTRELITGEGRESIVYRVGKELENFAGDLLTYGGLRAKVEMAVAPDSLHTLRIGDMHYFFNADGTAYDGCGPVPSGGDDYK